MSRKLALALSWAVVAGGMRGAKSLYDEFLSGYTPDTSVALAKEITASAFALAVTYLVLSILKNPWWNGNILQTRKKDA